MYTPDPTPKSSPGPILNHNLDLSSFTLALPAFDVLPPPPEFSPPRPILNHNLDPSSLTLALPAFDFFLRLGRLIFHHRNKVVSAVNGFSRRTTRRAPSNSGPVIVFSS